MVTLSDEWCPAPAVETECPLCWQPLNGEQHFHMECARRENAQADFPGEGFEEDNDDPIQSIEFL
jgi:hypothetical protein